jgi:iron complex outermembrane recepter protein
MLTRCKSNSWRVGLFVNHLFNQRYVTSLGSYTADIFGTHYATVTPPRVWGLELRAKF